jgi:uncharacterized Tic20 family protein
MSESFGTIPPKPDVGMPTNEERTWALLAHISPILLNSLGIGFAGPLVVWLVYKDKSPFVADQAKEALNFSLSVLIAVLVCAATCILIPVAIVVGVGALVYGIIAGIEANKGVLYRYPYTLRLIN